eukprot:GDKJ01026064.1.p1 GENE.GDKJ01026064.1~~GDKJ01026064.1.p1  ORF type:complete len:776 (+),score=164.30 GDKJ01026064.1:368-2695(+)
MDVTIRDTGRGVSESDLSHLFFNFSRAESSDSIMGTGLGLSITRSTVNAVNGGCRLASSGRGMGSSFTMWLPLVRVVGGSSLREGTNERMGTRVGGRWRSGGGGVIVSGKEYDELKAEDLMNALDKEVDTKKPSTRLRFSSLEASSSPKSEFRSQSESNGSSHPLTPKPCHDLKSSLKQSSHKTPPFPSYLPNQTSRSSNRQPMPPPSLILSNKSAATLKETVNARQNLSSVLLAQTSTDDSDDEHGDSDFYAQPFAPLADGADIFYEDFVNEFPRKEGVEEIKDSFQASAPPDQQTAQKQTPQLQTPPKEIPAPPPPPQVSTDETTRNTFPEGTFLDEGEASPSNYAAYKRKQLFPKMEFTPKQMAHTDIESILPNKPASFPLPPPATFRQPSSKLTELSMESSEGSFEPKREVETREKETADVDSSMKNDAQEKLDCSAKMHFIPPALLHKKKSKRKTLHIDPTMSKLNKIDTERKPEIKPETISTNALQKTTGSSLTSSSNTYPPITSYNDLLFTPKKNPEADNTSGIPENEIQENEIQEYAQKDAQKSTPIQAKTGPSKSTTVVLKHPVCLPSSSSFQSSSSNMSASSPNSDDIQPPSKGIYTICIDDDLVNRIVLKRLMSSLMISVGCCPSSDLFICSSAEKALNLLDELHNRFCNHTYNPASDVKNSHPVKGIFIITDLSMPGGKDGTAIGEWLTKLHSEHRILSHVQVCKTYLVLSSAYGSTEDVASQVENVDSLTAFDAFVAKPIDMSKLSPLWNTFVSEIKKKSEG